MSQDYTTISVNGFQGWVVGGVASGGLQNHLAAMLAMEGGAAWPAGRDRRIRRIIWAGRPYFVKHYRSLTSRARLRYALQRSKAHNAWRHARGLQQAGVATPEVVAYLQRGHWWDQPEQVLVMEGIPGTTLREAVQSSMPPRLRRRLILAVARFVARLHDAGIYHGDFSAFNIMVAKAADTPVGWKIYLIDLDAIRSVRRISLRRQIKNLDELGRNFTLLSEVSVLERLRFLRAYASARNGMPLPLPALKQAVCRRTDTRMRRYGKRFIPPS
ncbi:MAG: lipopolysaccharide kinase InaA family protein [Desulfosarcinaceae bacterium]|nr:lipopolysaccharide kinase InaA family protein [Desulfosarcinaceae bacterium]